jgi:hypothetical protein
MIRAGDTASEQRPDEEHGHEVLPTGEALGMAFGAALADGALKLDPGGRSSAVG